MRILIAGVLLLLLAACSDEAPESHVWQSQTDAIKKAENVNKIVMEQAERQREAIEQQSR